MRDRIVTTLFAALLAACSSGPDAPLPALELPHDSVDAEDLTAWWTRFHDPRLDALIARVLEHNHDLQIAAARVDEAAALLRSADDLMPEATLRAGVARNQTSDKNAFPRFPGIDRRNFGHTIGIEVLWEADLWGRIRAGQRASLAEMLRNVHAMHGLRSALLAQAAQSYFRLVAIDRRLALTTQTLRNREEAVRIQERRLAAGTGSRLEVRQAEGDLAEVQALLPRMLQAQAAAERGLLVLAGGAPRDFAGHAIARAETLPEPPAIPAGLPSDLLARRPDVREAEAALVASNARVSEAKARYFPTIRLTASAGQESRELQDLFLGSATVWNLAAGLTQPVFNLRKIDADVDAATARAAAAEAGYVRAAQAAFVEVYDALDARSASAATLAAQQRRIETLRDAERIARARHEAGAGAFLDLLDARRNLLEVETDNIDVAADRLAATVDVYRALGGGWQETVVESK